MWVLVVYHQSQMKMYEFETREEAVEVAEKHEGYKILTLMG